MLVHKKIFFVTIFFSAFLGLYGDGWDGVDNPRISIITSVYKGKQFIREFLEDIVQQTIFDECELLMIDANSPDDEAEVIIEYQKRYPNILYYRLEKDPGIYGVWNMGLKMARGAYVINANLDDRVDHKCYEIFACALDVHPEIALVYSHLLRTAIPNQTIECNSAHEKWKMPKFSLTALKTVCLPNDHPMWRKEVHEKVGYFDESFKVAGDYDMWVRMAQAEYKFLLIPQFLGLNYCNPSGLSTSSAAPLDELKKVRAKHVGFFYN